MLAIILVILSLVHSHKYYVERDQINNEDKIHLQLEGSSGKKCDVNLLERTDEFYHYVHGKQGTAKLKDVPCLGKHTISTGAAYPVYYVQVKSKDHTETLKLVQFVDQTPQINFKLNATSVEFTTRNVCSHPQTCILKSGEKILDSFIPKPDTECNAETHLTGNFELMSGTVELSCGVNHHKVHMYTETNKMMDFSLLDKYPYHITKSADNKIKITFDEDINDEICKFEINKENESNLVSTCSVTSNGDCFQLCTEAEMDLNFTDGTDKDFKIKVSTRNYPGVTKTLRIGKSDLTVTATDTTATISIDALKDDLTNPTCTIELRNQKFPKNKIAPMCDSGLNTPCPTTCTDSTIHGLEPNTKYIVKVIYTGENNAKSYIAEKLFKTVDHSSINLPTVKVYYEHVVITVAPNMKSFDGVYCHVQQKLKIESEFKPAECEESIDCSGLCGMPMTIKNLLFDSEYQFKYTFDKYVGDLPTNVVTVSTSDKLEKLTVSHTWKDLDLVVSTKIEKTDQEPICDFIFAEIEKNNVKYIYGLYDITTEWTGLCNREITFYNATSYRQSSMMVRARYVSAPVIVDLSPSKLEEPTKIQPIENHKREARNQTPMTASKILLIFGGVLIGLLVVVVGFLIFTRK